MDNRKVNIFLGIAAAILGIVSILTMLATCFGASDFSDHPSTLGNCYNVMFGYQSYNSVPLLITAFVLQIVGCVFAFFGGILRSKLGAIGLGIAALCFAIGGVFWFMSPGAFLSINKVGEAENVVLGTGSILTAVFSLGGGLVALYGAYRAFKA